MGVDLLLSLRLPPASNCAYARKLPIGVLPSHVQSFSDLSGQKQSLCIVATSNPDMGYSDSRVQTIHHQPSSIHHHPYHHHTTQRSMHARNSIASLCDNHRMEHDEHAIALNLYLHDPERSSPSGGKHGKEASNGGVAGPGIDLPLSIKMLKKKQQGFGKSPLVSGLSELGNSLGNAFSSVMFIMKTLQSHTLEMRRRIFKHEITGILGQAQTEMHTSFLWLFQQVFSCTPELMVLIMVLLADFTTFSVVNNVYALPLSLYSTSPLVATIPTTSDSWRSTNEGFGVFLNNSFTDSPSLTDGDSHYSQVGFGWIGNGGTRGFVLGRGSGDSDDYKSPMDMNKVPWSVDESIASETPSSQASAFSTAAAAIAFEELGASNDIANGGETVSASIESNSVESMESREVAKMAALSYSLGQEMIRSFVTPVEDDHYACYDKTDLGYTEALGSDSMNSMLLSNYAQFLFLVRKDHDRAEELFRKAILSDPSDCDAISRFASFLWLARRNVMAAEKAYRVAVCADPTNAFHAANYAHFLWNSGL